MNKYYLEYVKMKCKNYLTMYQKMKEICLSYSTRRSRNYGKSIRPRSLAIITIIGTHGTWLSPQGNSTGNGSARKRTSSRVFFLRITIMQFIRYYNLVYTILLYPESGVCSRDIRAQIIQRHVPQK